MQAQDPPTNRFQLIADLEGRLIPVWSSTGPRHVQVQDGKYPTWYGPEGNLVRCEIGQLERYWRDSREAA